MTVYYPTRMACGLQRRDEDDTNDGANNVN